MNKYFFYLLLIIIFGVVVTNKFYNYETFINKTNNLPLIYGKNCPTNKNRLSYDRLLMRWNTISNTYNIPYSITYGTLLGQIRHQDYIPYDEDIDIHIGIERLPSILSLLNEKWCCFNNELKKDPLKVGDIRLIINKWHNSLQDNNRERYNCKGIRVNKNLDSCSFNGLFARLVLVISENSYQHLDIFVYSYIPSVNKQNNLVKEKKCIKFNGPYCTYINSDNGTILPETKPCYLGNLKTRCFIKPTSKLLQWYGENYMKPNQIYKNNEWVKI